MQNNTKTNRPTKLKTQVAKKASRKESIKLIFTDSIESAIYIATSLTNLPLNGNLISYEELSSNWQDRSKLIYTINQNKIIIIQYNLEKYHIIWLEDNIVFQSQAYRKKHLLVNPNEKARYLRLKVKNGASEKYNYIKDKFLAPHYTEIINMTSNSLIGVKRFLNLYYFFTENEQLSLMDKTFSRVPLISLSKECIQCQLNKTTIFNTSYYDILDNIENVIIDNILLEYYKRVGSMNLRLHSIITPYLLKQLSSVDFQNKKKYSIICYCMSESQNELLGRFCGDNELLIPNKEVACDIVNKLSSSLSNYVLKDCKKEVISMNHTLQYNLYDLLLDADNILNLDAELVITTLDALYSNGYITYPHVNKRKISTKSFSHDAIYNIGDNIIRNNQELQNIFKASKLDFSILTSHMEDGSPLINDEAPILPTEKLYHPDDFKNLNLDILNSCPILGTSQDIFNIYFLILKKFLLLFLPESKIIKRTYILGDKNNSAFNFEISWLETGNDLLTSLIAEKNVFTHSPFKNSESQFQIKIGYFEITQGLTRQIELLAPILSTECENFLNINCLNDCIINIIKNLLSEKSNLVTAEGLLTQEAKTLIEYISNQKICDVHSLNQLFHNLWFWNIEHDVQIPADTKKKQIQNLIQEYQIVL